LIASELVFAIPVSIRRHGFRLHVREWGGIAAVTAGLTLGLVAAAPRQGDPLPSLVRWGETLGALAALAAVALLVARRVHGPARASLYAAAAVASLAAQSALLAATVALFKMGVLTALTSWQPYAMAVVSFVALTLVQSAYQAGPLAASMPVMDALNPVVGISVGIVLFDETIATNGWHLPGAVLGVALLVTGVLLLDTSPLVLRVQRVEENEQESAER
jgi:hypothetical protein